MSTEPPMPAERPEDRRSLVNRWGGLAVLAVVGGGVVIALLTQDRVREAIAIGALIGAYALILLGLSRRSETVALLSGDTSDERRASITMRANAATGMVMLTVLGTAFVVSLVNDTPDRPVYAGLCTIAGATYVAATAWLSWRS